MRRVAGHHAATASRKATSAQRRRHPGGPRSSEPAQRENHSEVRRRDDQGVGLGRRHRRDNVEYEEGDKVQYSIDGDEGTHEIGMEVQHSRGGASEAAQRRRQLQPQPASSSQQPASSSSSRSQQKPPAATSSSERVCSGVCLAEQYVCAVPAVCAHCGADLRVYARVRWRRWPLAPMLVVHRQRRHAASIFFA